MPLRLEEMTWKDVETEIENGNSTVLIPTAATEEHGPGLPIGTDTFRADELGNRVADELECVVAPTVRPGISTKHMSLPGTISLKEDTFKRVIRDYCESLDEHGFKNVVLISYHGGNVKALSSVSDELDETLEAHVFGPVRDVDVPSDRSGYKETRFGTMAEFDVSPDEAGHHAGAAEASAIMETYPNLVDTENLEKGHLGELGDVDDITEVSENGVVGDQRLGSRAAGRKIIDRVTKYYADVIKYEIE